MATAQWVYDTFGTVNQVNYPAGLNPVGSVAPGTSYYYGLDLMERQAQLIQSGYPSTILASANNQSGPGYAPSGQLQNWTEGNVTLSRSYDANRSWMTGLAVSNSSGSVLSQSYSQYYANGQLQTITDQVGSNASTATTYGYDYLSRLTTATNMNGSTQIWGLSWSYDQFGNRTSQTSTGGTQPGPSSSLTYDHTNYTNRIVTDGNNAAYSYDLNGNLTAFPGPNGATSASYDVFDRAVSFTVGSSTSTVVYDAFGRRIAKTF